MRAALIRIDAIDSGGTPVSVFLSSVDDYRCCHLDGQQWIPAIARLGRRRYDFFGGDLRGSVVSPTTSFAVSIDRIAGFGTLRFAGARYRLWKGEAGDAWGSYVLRFDGRIRQEPSVAEGIATFDVGTDDAWLDKPLLTRYAGSGGLEGPADLQGTIKPAVLGNCRFVPGVLIDVADLVYQVHGYGAIQAVGAVYDRVAKLGASTGDYADLAALKAATIPEGGWGTCLAEGLVRLGWPPDGQLSFDVSGDNGGSGGYVRLPGAIIGRIAELASGTVDATNLSALDTARPWNLSLVLVSQTTARAVIQELADSVVAVAGVTWTGTLFTQPLGYDTASGTLDSEGGSEPPVAAVAVQSVAAPFWKIETNAEPTWVVHDPASVASTYNYRGIYSDTREYRLDDSVNSADGALWAYINATPGAGNAPPTWPTTSNAWWENLTPPSEAANALFVTIYQRAASAPSVPSGDATFTFSTGALTGLDNGWTATIPAADGNPLYVAVAYARASGDTAIIATGDWSTPEIQAQDGADGSPGLSVAELTIYKRSASAPATPSGGSYDFGTKVLTPPSGWTTAVPAVDGNPLYVARGVAFVSGTTGTATPSWGAPAKALQDAEAVNIVFKRAASQPSTPSPSSGVPAGWSDSPPAGSDPLWQSYGTRTSPANNWTWTTPQRVDGSAGLSIAEVNVYRRASSAPSTPSGGSFNFGTQVLTAPSLWSVSIPPIDGNPLYVSRGVAGVEGQSGTDTPTWGTPVLALQDAEAVNVIFKRAASQPSTPSPSSGVPAGWSDTPPADDGNPLWASYGARTSPANNWTWKTPQKVQAEDGAIGIAFAQDTFPGFGEFVGQLWHDTNDNLLFRWTGSIWTQIEGDLAGYDSVGTDLIDADALNNAGFVTQTGERTCGFGSTDTQYFLGSTFQVNETGATRIRAIVPMRISRTDPNEGDLYAMRGRLGVRQDPSGTPSYSDYFVHEERWDSPDDTGLFFLETRINVMEWNFTGLTNGQNYQVILELSVANSNQGGRAPPTRGIRFENPRAME